MNITINVVGQKLMTNYTQIVEGSQNFVKFTFNLPNEWKEINPSACFSQDGKAPIGKILETDTDGQTFFTYLPPEITEGKCELSLFGAKESENGDIIGTSNCLTLTIDKKGAVDVVESQPTESIYLQWMEKVRLDTLSTIDNAVSEAKEDIITASDQAAKAVIDANAAIESAREAESITQTTVNNALESIGKAKGIPVVTELPSEAMDGDICLYSAPNSIDSSDSGGRIFIDWNAIMEYGQEWYFSENSDEGICYEIYDEHRTNCFNVSYSIADNGILINVFSNQYTGYSYDFEAGDYYRYTTEANFLIEGLDVGSDAMEFRIRDGINSNYIRKYYDNELLPIEFVWEYIDSDVNTLPKYLDLNFWSSLVSIAEDETEGFVIPDRGLFYSPYRLMTYRGEWVRLNNIHPLVEYLYGGDVIL